MSTILERMARRIMMTVLRGKILLVDDSGAVQIHQVDLGPQGPAGTLGLRDNTYAPKFFGFSSHPPAGADAIVLCVGGQREIAIVLGHNHQAYRLKNLGEGESALHDMWGNVVKMTEAGVEITHAAQVILTAPVVNVVGVLQVGGVAVTVP